MRCVSRKIFLITLFLAAGYLTQVIKAQQPPSATVFEGARLITGDGSAPVADSAFVVENGRFTAVGRKGQVKAPAGAAHVDLTGKTVIPAIIDAHKHLAVTRDALVDQLQHFAYYGIGATMSLGQDTGDEVYPVRAETIPNAARYRTAGRGITGPEPGRSNAPFWVTSEAEVRKDIDEMAAKKVDIIKFWVDDRDHTVTKLSPELYRAGIDEAHKKGLRTIAHIFTLEDAKGVLRAGIDNFAHSVRDKDVDDEYIRLVKAKPIPSMPPATRRPTYGADRANRAGNDTHQHRAIRLDHEAGHPPAVTAHQKIVDVHGGPFRPAAYSRSSFIGSLSPNLLMSPKVLNECSTDRVHGSSASKGGIITSRLLQASHRRTYDLRVDRLRQISLRRHGCGDPWSTVGASVVSTLVMNVGRHHLQRWSEQ